MNQLSESFACLTHRVNIDKLWNWFMEITGCKNAAFIAPINCLVLSAISMATVLHGGTCFVYLAGWCGVLVKDLG